MPDTKHTPGPWRLVRVFEHQTITSGESVVVRSAGFEETGPAEANAEFIVRACNNYEHMLALLIQLRDEWFEPHYGLADIGFAAVLRDKIRAAIAKAEGGE